MNASEFKRLLIEGISSVARKSQRKIEVIKEEMAYYIGVGPDLVDYWLRPNIPTHVEYVEKIVRYCTQNGRVDREWARSLLVHAGYPDSGVSPLLDEVWPPNKGERERIFIWYQPGQDPDEALAMKLARSFSAEFSPFFPDVDATEINWASRVQAALGETSYLIVLLSASSVQSEVLRYLLENVQALQKRRAGRRPILLPIRVNYLEALEEPLCSYITSVRWAYYRDEQGTDRLLAELWEAVSGGNLPYDETARERLAQEFSLQVTASHLHLLSGPLGLKSPFYIARPDDHTALRAIENPDGVTIPVKGSRQTGKSSLLIRIAKHAKDIGKRVAFLDFQLLQTRHTTVEHFFSQFCSLLSDELEMEDDFADYSSRLSVILRCSRYIENQLLKSLSSSLVLMIDNADLLLSTDFYEDFFSMLRSWHEHRAHNPTWQRLDLVLSISTEPYVLIKNPLQSPFNVGTVINLSDFSQEEVATMSSPYGVTVTPAQQAKLYTLLNGHPHLTSRTYYLLATQHMSFQEVLTQATNLYGPYGDHLRALLLQLHDKEVIIQSLRQIIERNLCDNPELTRRLCGIGIVREDGDRIIPRCQLYAEFFSRQFAR